MGWQDDDDHYARQDRFEEDMREFERRRGGGGWRHGGGSHRGGGGNWRDESDDEFWESILKWAIGAVLILGALYAAFAWADGQFGWHVTDSLKEMVSGWFS